MELDTMLIGLVLLGFAYLMGYTLIAMYAAAALLLIWLVGAMKPQTAAKKKDKFLEPIIIDSTRGAPYRIPNQMTLKFKPDEDPDAPKWYEAQDKGLGGVIGKSIGNGIRNLLGVKK